jgi:hypothetical protein
MMKYLFAAFGVLVVVVVLSRYNVPPWVDAVLVVLVFVIMVLWKIIEFLITDRAQERSTFYADRAQERSAIYQDRYYERATWERQRADDRALIMQVMYQYALNTQVTRALLEHVRNGTQFVEDRYGRWLVLADGQEVDVSTMPIEQFEAGQELQERLLTDGTGD